MEFRSEGMESEEVSELPSEEAEVLEQSSEGVFLRVSYWGHKISKSTSVDCNKIYIVTV